MACAPLQQGHKEEYKLLNLLEFNRFVVLLVRVCQDSSSTCVHCSTRKRMSVIVRTPDGQIKLFCKGAVSLAASCPFSPCPTLPSSLPPPPSLPSSLPALLSPYPPLFLPFSLPPLLSPCPPLSLPSSLPPLLSPYPPLSLPSSLPALLSPCPPLSLPSSLPVRTL